MATKGSDAGVFDPLDYQLLRAELRTLRTGARLVHSHRSDPHGKFAYNAFNPYADTRFAGVLASPRPAGYYAGTTAACALWEADLRNVVGDKLKLVSLSPEQFQYRRLSFVRTTRPLKILDLTPSALTGMVGDRAIQHRWNALTVIDSHAATHEPAAALLAQIAAWDKRVDGFAWYSRQCGTTKQHPIVYAFFDPPCSPSAFMEDPDRPSFMLDSPAGWKAIDSALAIAKLQRAASGPAIGAKLAPPSPDDEP